MASRLATRARAFIARVPAAQAAARPALLPVERRDQGGKHSGSGPRWRRFVMGGSAVLATGLASWFSSNKDEKWRRPSPEEVVAFKKANDELPVIMHPILAAPNVPPPVNRSTPARVRIELDTTLVTAPISGKWKYPFWTYNGTVPGPFIRARVGDILEVQYTNKDEGGAAHNIDFHAVTGPGGGAPALLAEMGETKAGEFKLINPGLYIYHCAAAPVPVHIMNGMYGLILVEPEGGLPKVDKEFYVLQSEWYAEKPMDVPDVLEPSYNKGLHEHPKYVTFNGRDGALTDKPLMANAGDRVRIFFGNAGPNLVSSFHVIGTIFDKVYREGDLVSPPARSVQTTLVPAGGAAVVEIDAPVPGNFTLVDHSIFRIDKGAIGFLKILGNTQRSDIFNSRDRLTPCPGCKLHN